MVAQSSITQYLLHNGIKPSFQRIKIFEYLIGKNEFPTIDTMYKDLKTELSTLSKTTIYNTLREFNKKSILNNANQQLVEQLRQSKNSVKVLFTCKVCNSQSHFKSERHLLPEYLLNTLSTTEEYLEISGTCKQH